MSSAAAITGSVAASIGAVLGGLVWAGQRPRRAAPVPVRVRPRRRRR